MTKPGRNDPCPCGSGKKYKKCCFAAQPAPAREEEERQKAVDTLLRFGKRNYRKELDAARLRFWGEYDPMGNLSYDEMEAGDINFWEWVVFDCKPDPENGKSLIDLYREKKRMLSLDEISMLEKMRAACLSLFEVREVFPDRGLILKDLLLGGEYEVTEKMATRGLRRWDILACRLLHIDGDWILTGAIYLYLVQQKEQVLHKIKNAFKKYKEAVPHATLHEFLKTEGYLFNHLWMETRSEISDPRLINASGEPVVISKAIYQIQDRVGLEQGLSALDDLERVEENQFLWLDHSKDKERPSILGTLTITGDTLAVEANSRERLLRAKERVATAARNAVHHQADSFQDPKQAAVDSRTNSVSSAGEEIPREIQEKLIKEYLDQHYEKWFDQKLPALNDKTPLEAMKTPEGKEQVIELLKLLENYEDENRRQGRPVYDVTWMWERLGLTRE